MEVNKCIICDVTITSQNDSKEHIIPNSIGGRKKISGFLCAKCNNLSGRNWDAELAKQLHPLSLFFNIEREKGTVPDRIVQTTNGEEYILSADGKMTISKPTYSVNKTEKGTEFNITARSESELRKILNNMKRKNPKMDIDKLMQQAKFTSSYPSAHIHHNLTFGGTSSGRSIVKTALAMAKLSGIEPKNCEQAMAYLLNEKGKACFGYFYESDIIINRPVGLPIHCVYLKGDPDTNLLLSYVEYFGIQRTVVCLSNNYKGKALENHYAINPQNSKSIELAFLMYFTPKDIESIYNYEKVPDGAIANEFKKIIAPRLEQTFEIEQNRVANEAVKYAFDNCGAKKGEEINEDQFKKLTALIIEKIQPFIAHNISHKKPK